MNKVTTTQLVLVSAVALAAIGVIAYVTNDTLFPSEEQRSKEGALLTTIAMHLQEASHRSKKNYEPMTRGTIRLIIELDTKKYNKEHKTNIKVQFELDKNKHTSAVKQIVLKTAATQTTIKAYYR